jgi:hypothetical protein
LAIAWIVVDAHDRAAQANPHRRSRVVEPRVIDRRLHDGQHPVFAGHGRRDQPIDQ